MASGHDCTAVVLDEGHCGNKGVGCLHGSWPLDSGWLWTLECCWLLMLEGGGGGRDWTAGGKKRLNQLKLLTPSSNILSTRSSLIYLFFTLLYLLGSHQSSSFKGASC